MMLMLLIIRMTGLPGQLPSQLLQPAHRLIIIIILPVFFLTGRSIIHRIIPTITIHTQCKLTQKSPDQLPPQSPVLPVRQQPGPVGAQRQLLLLLAVRVCMMIPAARIHAISRSLRIIHGGGLLQHPLQCLDGVADFKGVRVDGVDGLSSGLNMRVQY